MLGRKQWQGIIWNLENDLLTCLTDFISNKFYFQTNNFSDNNRDLMILTAKDSHLSGSTHLKNISQLFTPWRPNPIPHQTDLPPSEVNNKKIFETITWVHLGNVESLPFLTVHVQSSYSLHMPTPLKQMANQDMPFPPPPKKKTGTCSSSSHHFPTLNYIAFSKIFLAGGGEYLRLCMNWKKINKDLPTGTAKFFLIQIPLKHRWKEEFIQTNTSFLSPWTWCIANKHSRIRREYGHSSQTL